jgi:DivIVA domain-containing protein
MMWFFAILIVLAMGGIAMVAAGRGAPMAPAYDDRPDATVPRDGVLGAEDLRRVRFSLAFRGYRMSEVDALLSRLAGEMEDRDLRDAPEGDDGPATPSTPAR